MSRAVTVDTTTLLEAPPPECTIVGEMLIQEKPVRSHGLSSLDAIKQGADQFKVTRVRWSSGPST